MYKRLILGELQRLQKYNVTLISLLVVLMWGAMIYFIDDIQLVQSILPFIIVIDITVMPLLYAGAVLFFEKSESTLMSLLVSPLTHKHMIFSKIYANIIHQMISTLLVLLTFYILKSVDIPIIELMLVMILAIFLHTLLGFIFVYISKDFTGMLTNVMVALILLSVPSILYTLQVIELSNVLRYILLLSPFESTLTLVNHIFLGDYSLSTLISIAVLIGWSFAACYLVVLPRFKTFVQKGSGV